MKDTLYSAIRHALTALAGLGGFLASKGFIEAADAAPVDAAGVTMADALAAIAAALLARLVIFLLSGLRAGGSGRSGNWLVLAAAGLAGFSGFSLPACSPAQREALRQLPIRGCVETDYGTACYSAKGGLEVRVDRRSGK